MKRKRRAFAAASGTGSRSRATRRKAEALDAAQEAADEYDEEEERATADMDEAREKFRAALRAAYESGAASQELGDLLGLSRQRVRSERTKSRFNHMKNGPFGPSPSTDGTALNRDPTGCAASA
jgi:hypothetical protein